jgi:hypothetical protein
MSLTSISIYTKGEQKERLWFVNVCVYVWENDREDMTTVANQEEKEKKNIDNDRCTYYNEWNERVLG